MQLFKIQSAKAYGLLSILTVGFLLAGAVAYAQPYAPNETLQPNCDPVTNPLCKVTAPTSGTAYTPGEGLKLLNNVFSLDTTGATAGQYLKWDGTGVSWATPTSTGISGSGTVNIMPKWNTGGTSLTNSGIIENATGNVGIGTMAPGVKLDVNGGDLRISDAGIGSQAEISIDSNIGAGMLNFYKNGALQFLIRADSDANGGTLTLQNSADKGIAIKGNGNVTVGSSTTNAPGPNLTVYGGVSGTRKSVNDSPTTGSFTTYSEPTATGTYGPYGLVAGVRSGIPAGVSNNGSMRGSYSYALRNQAPYTNDNGYLQQMVGTLINFGHNLNSATATPQTKNIFGLYINPYMRSGTVTGSMYDLYLSAGNTTGGTISGKHYGVYQAAGGTTNYLAGNVGIKTNNPSVPFQVSNANVAVSPKLFSQTAGNDLAAITANGVAPGFNIVSASSTALNRGVFKGTRSRGTLTAPTVPQLDDQVVSLLGSVYDGVSNEGTAQVVTKVDGPVSAGVAPQRIAFETSTTNAVSRTERMVIKANGNVLVGSSTDNTPGPIVGVYGGVSGNRNNKDTVSLATGNFSMYSQPIASGAFTSYGVIGGARSNTPTGVSNTGALTGGYFYALRNQPPFTADNGTLTNVRGSLIAYGHNNTGSATANPKTTNVTGLYLNPYNRSGTITGNMFDLYLATGNMTGGTIGGKHYGIAQVAGNITNYFMGNTGIGTTAPSNKLSVSGNADFTGNVGIGTATPNAKLQVAGGDTRIGEITPYPGTLPALPPATESASQYGRKLFFSGGSSSASSAFKYDSDNSDPLWIARFNRQVNGSQIRVNLGDEPAGGGDSFVIGSTNSAGTWNSGLAVYPDGRTVIGATIPTGGVKLDVKAAIRIGDTIPSNLDCDNKNPGTIKYDSVTDHFYGCRWNDGTSFWAQLDN